ncbi:MAG TPA: hypothetical protein ENJ18_13785 [Nannocystis exedens]|nr:hypothetical protein [Nannocystis exedens]
MAGPAGDLQCPHAPRVVRAASFHYTKPSLAPVDTVDFFGQQTPATLEFVIASAETLDRSQGI